MSTRRSILMPAVRSGHAYLVTGWAPLDMRLVFRRERRARWPWLVVAAVAFAIGGLVR